MRVSGEYNQLHLAALAESKTLWQMFSLGMTGLWVLTVFWMMFVVTPKLNKTEPIFVKFTTSDDVFFETIPVRGITKTQEEFLIKSFLREYVDYAETYDHDDLVYFRAEKLVALSSPNIVAYHKDKFQKSKEIFKEYTREVSIISDSTLELIRDNDKNFGIHQVEFRTIDRKKGTDFVEKKNWLATLKYEYVIGDVNESEATLNPLNIKVYDYQINVRDVAEEPTNITAKTDSNNNPFSNVRSN